jgi:hypothetical protein
LAVVVSGERWVPSSLQLSTTLAGKHAGTPVQTRNSILLGHPARIKRTRNRTASLQTSSRDEDQQEWTRWKGLQMGVGSTHAVRANRVPL